jgi:flagellar basal-body rod protein FlgB
MSDIQLMEKLLDATALRQRVLANNLANINTPQFKRRDVQFRDMLAKAMESADPHKMDNMKPAIVEDMTSLSRPDGNNVSMQKELGEMTENGMLYQLASQIVKKKFDGITRAIKGR